MEPKPMNKVKLTPSRLQSAGCEPGKPYALLWDSEAAGLALRTTPKGVKAWHFQFRIDGKPANFTIGSIDNWTLGDARTEARRLKVLVDRGEDPREEKKAKTVAREAKREKEKSEALTLGEAWSTYLEENTHRWSEHHLRDHNKMMAEPGLPRSRSKVKETVAGPLWGLRGARLIDIPALVPHWAKEEAKHRPTQAKLALRLLKTLLLEHDIVLKDAIGRSGQAKLRKALPKSVIKKTSIQESQLKAWWSGTLLLPPATSAYLRFLVITGARPTEGAMLDGNKIDLKWNTMTIRDKINSERTIPLTPYVKRMLLELREYAQVLALKRAERGYIQKEQSADSLYADNINKAEQDPDYVFRAMTGTGHLTNADKGHNKVLSHAGLPKDLSLHSLRKSFETLWEQADLPSGAASQISGRAAQSIREKHYMNRDMDRLRDLLTRYEDWLLDKARVNHTEAAIQNRTRRTLLAAR